MRFWSRLPADRILADVSLWSARLENLGASLRATDACADLYHFDVADARFVPGLLFFPDLLAALRPLTGKPLHAHLMVERPERLVEAFVAAGADLVTVHAETASAAAAIARIEAAGATAGLALRLDTPLEAMEPFLERIGLVVLMGTPLGIKGVALDRRAAPRIREARRRIAARGLAGRVKIAADGGIRAGTVPELRAAGADVVTPGSLVFGSADLAATTRWLHGLPAPAAAG